MENLSENRKLSGQMLFAVSVFASLFGLAAYPIDALGQSIRGRPFALLLAAVPLAAALFLFMSSFYRSGTESFFDMLESLFGKYLGKAFLIIFSLYFLVRASLAVSEQSSMIKLYLLEDTPFELILLFILFSAALAVSTGLRRLAYTSVIVLIIIALPLLFVIISMLFKSDLCELRILKGSDFSLIRNELPTALLSVSGCECGLLFLGKTRSRKSNNALLIAVGAVLLCALLVCLLSIGMLSVEAADAVRFPFVEAAKLIDFAGASFSERIDLLPITVLLLGLVIQTGAMLYCSAASLAAAIGLDSPNVCIYLLPPFSLLLSYFLGGTDVVSYAAVIGLMLIFVISLLCRITLFMKDRKRGSGDA